MANCGNLVQAKQIFKILACPVRIDGFTTTVSTSDIITTDLTTILTTAGSGGAAVPLVVSPDDQTLGVITTGVSNRIEIWDNTSRLKIQDGDGNEVYGRITEAAGVYTISYYSIVAGTETAFSFDGRDIDFSVNYRFDFNRFPGDCATSITSRNVNDDPETGVNGRHVCEELPVTALNTITSLTFLPATGPGVTFHVNHIGYGAGGSSPFTLTGKVVTWDDVAGQYDIETTDCVEVCYFTHE